MASDQPKAIGESLQTIPSDSPMPPVASPPDSPTSRRSGSISENPTAGQHARARNRTNTASSVSSIPGMIRRASLNVMNADMPLGFLSAAGNTVAAAPTVGEIRRGSFTHDGWTHDGQVGDRRRRSSVTSNGERRVMSRSSSGFSVSSLGRGKRTDKGTIPGLAEEPHNTDQEAVAPAAKHADAITTEEKPSAEMSTNAATPTSSEEYVEAPKLPWTTSWAIGLRAFWKWFLTPFGFCLTIYGLNVVAWGGMLFLLLCNASPAMCHPSCNDLYSPRRIWIEIDSQILNALFCVTGFGLIPWRFRDLYWLMVYRLGIRGRSREQRLVGLRRLAGIHRSWFRLPGSDKEDTFQGDDIDNPTLPLPLDKRLGPPLTGVRAPPTAMWRMDYVIWMNCWNTFLQGCLCGFMWGYNRYKHSLHSFPTDTQANIQFNSFKRPSWSTGFFVAIACIVAALAGIMMAIEGKKVKKVEGVPPKVLQRVQDAERQVLGHSHPKKERFRAFVPSKDEKGPSDGLEIK